MAKLRDAGLPDPVREHQFDADRQWRFDFAWPDVKLAVEVEGGIFSSGRHVRGAGFEADCYKYNRAVMLGWRVLRFTRKMIRTRTTVEQIGTFHKRLRGNP